MRLEHRLIALLLIVRLLLLVWNVSVFDGETYDQYHHVWRLKSAGFTVAKMAYNGPLYYLSGLPYVALDALGLVPGTGTGAGKGWLLFLARWSNVGWLALFYISWIWGVFKRLLPDARTWMVASAVLLSLPGYQKVGTLVHPDNMLAAMMAAGFAAWLILRDKPPGAERTRGTWLLTVLVGLLGSVRPFAIVPVAVLWGALMRLVSTAGGPRWVRRAVAMTLVSATLAGAWYGVRAVWADAVLDAYQDKYLDPYREHREGFEFGPYFTTFHVSALLDEPNRTMDDQAPRHLSEYDNPYGNSFFTIAYSELWGDHWLYVSGPKLEERKKLAKQALLTAALPYTALLLGRLGWGLGATLIASAGALRRREWHEAEVGLALIATLVLGLLLYLYWQTGPALLPGKNSSIKFLYNAHLVPVAIALAFLPRVRFAWAWMAAALTILAISVPFLVFVPQWLS